MKKWSGWRSQYANEKYDVIIIGSGISGLTAGVLLAEKGKKVLILEKHFKVGGWTHTFKRDYYEWDVGIHYIGEVHSKRSPVRKLFDQISNGQLEWNKMDDNYDRIIFPDQEYNFTAPRERFIPDMIEHFPGIEDKLVTYLDLIDSCVKSGQNYFANKALPVFLDNFTYKKMTQKYFKYSDRTTKDVIMDIFDDEKILGVLTGQWGDYGLPPAQSSFAMHAMVVRHYLNGGNYPIGTSRKIAETSSDYLESMGGKIYVNANVDEILIEKRKTIGVQLESGEQIATINIKSSELVGIDIPEELVSVAIDELPIILVAAASAKGETRLSGAAELRVKESDRIQSMLDGFVALGIKAEALNDGMIIEGGKFNGGVINSYGDHRIAMAFSVAGIIAKSPILINNCNNVATSFPEFVETGKSLGINIDYA